jgi:microcin C transport system substrate-binding protein
VRKLLFQPKYRNTFWSLRFCLKPPIGEFFAQQARGDFMKVNFQTVMRLFLAGASVLFVSSALAAVPTNLVKMDIKPLGNPNAPKTGTFQWSFSAEPETLNPINSQDRYAQYVQDYVMDGLLTMNDDTYEFEPNLAESYEMSPDQMIFTFHLRKDLKFSDGHPLTAEDVKFSFDAVKDPAFKAISRQPYYENISSVEVIDPLTIKITTKKKYFHNLEVMASVGFTQIAPKHIYGDPKKKMAKELVGSGPYKLGEYNRGKNMTLERNKDWWGYQVDHLKRKFNFDRILIRFVKEENLEIELLKKGEIDFMGEPKLTNEAFMKKMEGPPFGTTVIKKKVENSDPTRGYGFVAWNFKSPLFQDRDVRVALAHLMNRDEMNKKFRYGLSVPATGPWAFNNPYANKSLKPIGFDLAKAKSLLKKAGWEDSDKNGVLDKVIDGKKVEMSFSLMFPNKDTEKYYTLYREDLKKAGINMDLKLVEWNTFMKTLNEQKFDAVSLAWGGGSLETDPKQIWHSSSANPGGSNFISYKNPQVDKLIDEARETLDKKKRGKMWAEIHRLIAEDAPYAFMFDEKYFLYVHNKKVKMASDTYKYNIGRAYWWSGN